jgi:hypothetical protein
VKLQGWRNLRFYLGRKRVGLLQRFSRSGTYFAGT